MNNLERYFDRNRHLADSCMPESHMSEDEFVGRLHLAMGRAEKARAGKRMKTAAWTFIGMAASLAIAALMWNGAGQKPEDPAVECISGYEESVKSLCADVRDLEEKSPICREMELSRVIPELMDSSYAFAYSLDGLDDVQRMEAVRDYCGRQMNLIRDLYRECVTAYETGTASN